MDCPALRQAQGPKKKNPATSAGQKSLSVEQIIYRLSIISLKASTGRIHFLRSSAFGM